MIHLFAFVVLPPALLVLAICFALQRWQPAAAQRVATALSSRTWTYVSAAVIAMFLAALAFTFALPAAMDAVEATVCEIAALMLRGAPAYTTGDAAQRYSLLYGPLCYLPYTLALAMFGPSILTLKAALVAIDITAVALLYGALAAFLNRTHAFIATAACVAALMLRDLSIFQIRGDATLLLAVATALLALSVQRKYAASFLFSVGAALALDVKFTAVFYLLLPFYLLYRRRGWGTALATVGLTGGLAAAPFALSTVSLRNYIFWIRAASHHPLSARLFIVNVISIVLLLLPAIVLASAMGRERVSHLIRSHRLALLLLAISIAGSVVTGSKVGAGRSHLNGTMLVITYLTAMMWMKLNERERALPALRFASLGYAILLVIPVADQLRDLAAICLNRRAYALSVLNDINAVRMAHPQQTIEEGYTDSKDSDSIVEPLALFRTELVLRGSPTLVDAGALFDMGLSGFTIPQTTVDSLSRCQPGLWLIPRGGVPFALDNAYVTDAPGRFTDPHLFTQAFRDTFTARYHHSGATQFFDVWQCNAAVP